jgi:branched-chain amino acid transport system substrate-binding protein
MNKKNAVVAVVAVTLAAIGAVLYLQAPGAAKDSVAIAANLPLSGPLATYGVAVREGATMALEEFVESPLNRKRLTVDWQDNASEPKTAVSVFRKQILSEPTIYVSGVKPQTMAIRDELSDLGIPHFVWIFDRQINKDSSNNFRTWVSYKIEPPIYKAYAERVNAKRIAITYVQLPHTVDVFENVLIPDFRNSGIEVFVEPFDFGRSDFKDIAAKLNAFKPDLIILNGFQSDLVGLIRSLRPLQAITDGNTIGTYDLLDAAKILGAEEIEGVRVVAPVFETRPHEPRIAEWRDRFQKRFGKAPLYTHAFAYDMITAIEGAMGMEGGMPDSREEWISALRAVNKPGITGPIQFDSDGDLLTPLEVGVYRDGRLVPDTIGTPE